MADATTIEIVTTSYLPRIFMAIIIFIAFYIAARIAKSIITTIGERTGMEAQVLSLLRQVASATILIFGVITALGTAGINVSALVAGLGLTGFALGFALKDALSNLLSGVMILVYKPFKVGDVISVTGYEGIVVNIDLRYTTIENKSTKDSDDSKAKSIVKKILIPNSTLFTKAISIIKEDQ
jgi:small-conductance mechanosensitive channel